MKKPTIISAGPLSHLRVLDMSTFVAGPYCARLLAGLGAEVIKIEEPVCGDLSRQCGPFIGDVPHNEGSALFSYLNGGKKSVTLDIKCIEGKQILEKLIRSSGVIIESLGPRRKAEMQISNDLWMNINPELIITSITNFGNTGPKCGRPATELTLLAEGGYLFLGGKSGQEPLKPHGYQGHYTGGLQAAIATLTALFHRRITGKGQTIELSLQEAVAFLMNDAAPVYVQSGVIYRRYGSRVATSDFYKHYSGNLLPCKDGYVFVAIGQNPQMAAFLMSEPRFERPEFWDESSNNADEIDDVCIRWLQKRTREQATLEAQEVGLAIAPAYTLEELLDNPHLRERKIFNDALSERGNFTTLPALPFSMTHGSILNLNPPSLGEHNHEVLSQVGIRQEDLSRLKSIGVL